MFQVYSDFSSKPHGLSPVQYSHVYINIGNCYDVVTHSFRPLRDGVYWFIFDTFANELGKVDYSMRELLKDPIVTSIYAERCVKNVFSRSDLRQFQGSSRLQMFSKYQYFVWEDGMHGITWGGFYINNISSDPPIAFNVVSNNMIEDDSYDTIMAEAFSFGLVLVNSGKCWNALTRTFTAPFDGIYYFSFSTITRMTHIKVVLKYGNILTNYTRQEWILRNHNILMTDQLHTSLLRSDDFVPITRSVSGSAILQIAKGVSAFIFKETYDFTQASFRGFLYAPPNSKFVAWCSQMTRDMKFGEESIYFDTVSVDIGGVFKYIDKSVAEVPKGGIYYVNFNAICVAPYGIGLFVNNIKRLEIISYDKDDGVFMEYERSALLKLAAGDEMSLRVINFTNANGYMFAHKQRGPVFAGFLVSLSQ